MGGGSPDEKQSILFFGLKNQSAFETHVAKPTPFKNVVSGSAFVVDLFDGLESIRVSAH